jgi:hypothetical protein
MTQRSKWTAIALLLLLLAGGVGAFFAISHTSGRAVPSTSVSLTAGLPAANVLRIQAYIDGRSRLQLRGDTAQWLNLEYSVPGTSGRTPRPTIVNGRQWYPQWTKAPDGGNNLSDVRDGVQPPVPAKNVPFEVKLIRGRGAVSIVQQPAAENQYTLIVEFDDSIAAGAADYIAEISRAKPGAATTQPATSPSVVSR